MKTKSHYDSPLGGITLITDETALLGLWFDWQPGYADDDSAVLGDSPTIGAAKRWLDEYFAGCIPRTEVPLRLEGTPFAGSMGIAAESAIRRNGFIRRTRTSIGVETCGRA